MDLYKSAMEQCMIIMTLYHTMEVVLRIHPWSYYSRTENFALPNLLISRRGSRGAQAARAPFICNKSLKLAVKFPTSWIRHWLASSHKWLPFKLRIYTVLINRPTKIGKLWLGGARRRHDPSYLPKWLWNFENWKQIFEIGRGLADVTRIRRESGAYVTQMSRGKFEYDVRHVDRVSCKCWGTCRARSTQQGMLLRDPSVNLQIISPLSKHIYHVLTNSRCIHHFSSRYSWYRAITHYTIHSVGILGPNLHIDQLTKLWR
jgi:hypothetical protein